MKIERLDKTNSVDFVYLCKGDTFEWNDNIFMKIHPYGDYNAVVLSSGALTNFRADDKITRVNVKLVVEKG